MPIVFMAEVTLGPVNGTAVLAKLVSFGLFLRWLFSRGFFAVLFVAHKNEIANSTTRSMHRTTDVGNFDMFVFVLCLL